MSKAKRSEFLRGFGKMFEIIKVLINAILDIGGDDRDLERILKDEALRKEIAALIVGTKKFVTDTFRAACDYSAPTYADLKSAFDWVHGPYKQVEMKPIDSCASVSRECGVVTFEYVYFGRSVITADALGEMEKRNLRPALFEEGLAFAKAHPDEQRKFDIAIIGSYCVDQNLDHDVALLRGDKVGRDLTLRWNKAHWKATTRFLAVPNAAHK